MSSVCAYLQVLIIGQAGSRNSMCVTVMATTRQPTSNQGYGMPSTVQQETKSNHCTADHMIAHPALDINQF